MIPNRNVLWGRVVAQEIARGGVQHVCIAPGSRSTPLVLGLHEEPGLRLSTHLDERGAAFFALGVAKATRRPVALVATSGTAVANFLPAIIEASYARVPLVALTADRPPELQDVGANQSIDQRGIFGVFPRFAADAGLPEPRPDRVRHLRALVGRALALSLGPPAGPVHLNLPFREPLEPTPVAGDVPDDWARGDVLAERGRPESEAFLQIPLTLRQPDPEPLLMLAEPLRSPRGLIVVGPHESTAGFCESVFELSRRTGYPILADPLSGCRFGAPSDVPVLSGYDAFLGHEALWRRLRPDVILRLGATPTSRTLVRYLQDQTQAHQILVDESGRLGEETATAKTVLHADPTVTLQSLLGSLDAQRESEWASTWLRLERTTWEVLAREVRTRPLEGAAIARLLEVLPSGATLFVSNSLPVRDLDRFGRGTPKALHVLGNRGASGIDGIISTALGAAYGAGRRLTLIIGDLAFLHDVNGLVAARRLGIPIDILLLNNDGGGIFEFLPVSRHEPPFTELFVTPHGLDLKPLAQAFGFAHERLVAADASKIHLEGSGPGGILEVVSDRKENVRHRREIEALLARALEEEATIRAG